MSETNNNQHLDCQLPPNSRLVVVGLGGIGSALLEPLAIFLNSLRIPLRLVLVDGDNYEPANTMRQAFNGLGNKAEIKASEITGLLGTSGVTVVAVPEYLQQENIERIVRSGDFVFLCVDNHPTRKLVSDHCQSLADIALFNGGNDGYDPPREMGTYGDVSVAIRRADRDVTVPITHYHPEIAQSKGKLPHELGCGQLVQSTPQILFTNLAVASAMVNAFFTFICGRLTYQEVKLDILAGRMLPQFPINSGNCSDRGRHESEKGAGTRFSVHPKLAPSRE